MLQAEDVCCSIGQYWRAASLEGWKLFHDPNLTNEGGLILYSVKTFESLSYQNIYSIKDTH